MKKNTIISLGAAALAFGDRQESAKPIAVSEERKKRSKDSPESFVLRLR